MHQFTGIPKGVTSLFPTEKYNKGEEIEKPTFRAPYVYYRKITAKNKQEKDAPVVPKNVQSIYDSNLVTTSTDNKNKNKKKKNNVSRVASRKFWSVTADLLEKLGVTANFIARSYF